MTAGQLRTRVDPALHKESVMKLVAAVSFFVAVVFLLPSSSFALTMDQLFDHVKKNHPHFKSETLRSAAERKILDKRAGEEDWIARFAPSLYSEEYAWSQSFVPDSVDKYGVDASVERMFWATGGRFSLSYTTAYIDQVISDVVLPMGGTDVVIPGGSGSYYENGLSLTYIHPFMKNKGGVLSRLGYELQKEEIKATDLDTIEQKESFLVDVGELFIDLALLEEQLEIGNRRFLLAKEEFLRTKKKRAQNMVDEVDLYRAEDAALAGEQVVRRIEAALFAKRAELKTLAMIESDEAVTPDYDLYHFEELPAVEKAVSMLDENSRTLKMFDARVRQSGLVVKSALNSQEPSLNLMLSGGLSSAAEEYGDAHEYDAINYTALLSFSYPLGNRSAKAESARATIVKERTLRDKEKTALKLHSALKNLWTQISELSKVLAIDEKRIATAKAKTKAEMKRYNQGRSELSFVIQSRDGEQQAALIRAQNATLYQKLTLYYRALTDTLYTPDDNG